MTDIRPPDYRRGFLRVPLPVWLDVYCRAPLTRRQLQLVSIVIRESWGWHSKDGGVCLWTRPMLTNDFARFAGLSTDHIRRDLRTLIDRRVLLERDNRYHFIADVRQWITHIFEPPKQPLIDDDSAETPAESAPAAPRPYISNRQERNVHTAPEHELSTPVDNSESMLSHAPSAFAQDDPSPPVVERLVTVVAAFVGSLLPTEAEGLRNLICRDGVAAVWRALEPSLRHGMPFAKRELERLIASGADQPYTGPLSVEDAVGRSDA